MSHHSWQHRASVGIQTDEDVTEYVTLAAAPYAATASPISVTEYATLAPTISYVTPAPVIEHMPAPVIEYIEPPPAVFYPTGLVNPQISTSAVEASQVVGPFPLSDDFAAPMYNQVHHEQIVATVRPHVIIQEPPQVPVGEWSQEQTVETSLAAFQLPNPSLPFNTTKRKGETKTCNNCWVCFSSHEHIPTSGAQLCPEGVCWRPACIKRSCDSAAIPCSAWTPDAVKWFTGVSPQPTGPTVHSLPSET